MYAPRRPKFGTSGKELLHLLVATVGLTTALFIWFDRGQGPFRFRFETLDLFGKILLSFAVVVSGFVLHEMGHKFTAQRFGHWSEFRLWPAGLILAIASAFAGFLLAAPGATWHTATNKAEHGKVSAVGPLTNVIVMLIAFPFTTGVDSAATLEGNIAAAVLAFNGILAIFNLLPFGPLDGKTVLEWSPFFYLLLVGLAIGAFIWTGAFFVV